MSVVYGTDFSAPAQAGAAAAAALAQRRGEDLLLVHAIEPEERFWAEQGGEERAQDLLYAAADDLRRRHPAVEVRPILIHGPAHEALARLTAEHGASLLVVASQGHSSTPVLRVGGTSERLALCASLPVLVVRESEPFERWAAGERPLRVVLGLDESAASEAAIRFVQTLREAGPCDVTAARVYAVPEERRRYGLRGPAPWLEPDPQLERLLERDLRARLAELPGSGTLEYRVRLGIGRQGDDLLHLAELERADLVVVGSHQWTGLPRLASVTSVLLHFGRMAIAAVPTPAGEETSPREVSRIRRVAAATDLSPFANHAIRHAYALATDREGAEVLLLHVAGKGAPDAERTAELAARLRELVPPEAGAIPTRTEILHGEDVAGTLCAAAERLGVDVLAIASHGKSGVLRAVLGSVAEGVVRQSRRPVLVVRPPER